MDPRPDAQFDCSESNAWPVIDAIWAGSTVSAP
jgi:hypothetical protein